MIQSQIGRWIDRMIGGRWKKNRWREIEGEKRRRPRWVRSVEDLWRSLETASSRTLLNGRSWSVADFNGGFLRLANRTLHETPSSVSRSVIQRFDDFTAKRGEIYIVASYVIWFEESSSKQARVGHALCLVACLATFTLVLNLRLDTRCIRLIATVARETFVPLSCGPITACVSPSEDYKEKYPAYDFVDSPMLMLYHGRKRVLYRSYDLSVTFDPIILSFVLKSIFDLNRIWKRSHRYALFFFQSSVKISRWNVVNTFSALRWKMKILEFMYHCSIVDWVLWDYRSWIEEQRIQPKNISSLATDDKYTKFCERTKDAYNKQTKQNNQKNQHF